jgi:hypothetical protein
MKTTLQLLLLLTTFFMLSGVNAAFTFDDDGGEVATNTCHEKKFHSD